MKIWWMAPVIGCVSLCTSLAEAQTPLARPGERAVDATAGNNVLQLRYLGAAPPLSGVGGNHDFGALLTERREFNASAAWMFDTNFVPLRRLRLQVGPRADLAWLATGSKTQVFALGISAAARYELIERLGLSAFGSAAYSPGVLTFGSAHNLYDFTAGVEIRFVGRLYALGGYRWFKFTLVNEPDERRAGGGGAGGRGRRE